MLCLSRPGCPAAPRLSTAQARALALRSAHTAGRRKDLHDPLNALALIYEGMLDSGPQGMLDMTEYCNAVGAHPPTLASGTHRPTLQRG